MSDPCGHGFLDYALSAAVSIGGAYFAAVDLSEALALLFTEGAIDEAAAAAGADTAVVWVGTVLRAVWDIYHLVTDLSTFIHVLQQIYQALLSMFTSGLGPGGGGSGSSGGGTPPTPPLPPPGGGGGPYSGRRIDPLLAEYARGYRDAFCLGEVKSPEGQRECLQWTVVLLLDAVVDGSTEVHLITVNMFMWTAYYPARFLESTGRQVIFPYAGARSHVEGRLVLP